MIALRLMRSALAVLVLAITGAGCTEREAGNGADADGAPRRGGTLVVAVPNDPGPANPLVAGDKYGQEVTRELLFLPLLRYDSTLDYVAALAESWEMTGDTGAVLRLRRDVRWHDGARTTAADVVFTIERAMDPKTAYPNASYFTQWTGVEALDSFTVRVRFPPHAEPLAGLPFLPIVPHHLLDTVPAERIGQAPFSRAPVGNGPFRFVEFRANERWIFAANDDFPEDLGGRPYLDRVVLRIVPEPASQVAELRAGTIDLALAPPAGEFMRMDSLPQLRGIARPSRQVGLIGWNNRNAPLDDPAVRRALGLALDRRQMIALRYGHGELAAGPVPPYHWAYPDDVEPLPHAPDSARALLAAAGIRDRDGDGRLDLPDGRPFEIEYHVPANNAFNRDLAELVRGDLAEIGVGLDLRFIDYNSLIQDAMTRRTFDAAQLAFESDFRLAFRDMFHSAEFDGPFQFAGYANPAVDSLIEALELTLDRDEARPLYEEFQRIMRDEQPWTILYYYPDLFTVNERVRNVRMDIRGVFTTLPQWWLSDAAPAPGDSAVRSPSPDSAPAR